MADESKAKPAPPLRGMIKIDGHWVIRRAGLLVQRQLRCIFGHRIKLGEGKPFEVAVPCGFMEIREAPDRDLADRVRCDAQVYLFVTRPRLIWAMDVTQEESALIDREMMDTDEIVAYFGVGFPVDMKIARLKA